MNPAWQTQRQQGVKVVFLFETLILVCDKWRAAYVKFCCAAILPSCDCEHQKKRKQWKILRHFTMILMKYWGGYKHLHPPHLKFRGGPAPPRPPQKTPPGKKLKFKMPVGEFQNIFVHCCCNSRIIFQ
jgi:hypothetical protein